MKDELRTHPACRNQRRDLWQKQASLASTAPLFSSQLLSIHAGLWGKETSLFNLRCFRLVWV